MYGRRQPCPVRPRRRLAGDRAAVPGRRRHDPARDDPHPARRPRVFESRAHARAARRITAALDDERTALAEDVDVRPSEMTAAATPTACSSSMPRFGIETKATSGRPEALGMPLAFDAGPPTSPASTFRAARTGSTSGGHPPGEHRRRREGHRAAAATAIGMDDRRLRAAAAQGDHPPPRPPVPVRPARCRDRRGPVHGPRGRPDVGR